MTREEGLPPRCPRCGYLLTRVEKPESPWLEKPEFPWLCFSCGLRVRGESVGA